METHLEESTGARGRNLRGQGVDRLIKVKGDGCVAYLTLLILGKTFVTPQRDFRVLSPTQVVGVLLVCVLSSPYDIQPELTRMLSFRNTHRRDESIYQSLQQDAE